LDPTGKCGGGGIISKNMGTYQQRRNYIEKQANAWEKEESKSIWTNFVRGITKTITTTI